MAGLHPAIHDGTQDWWMAGSEAGHDMQDYAAVAKVFCVCATNLSIARIGKILIVGEGT